MARQKKLSEAEIANAVDREVAAWEADESTTLSSSRARAMEYYLGEPFGNEQEGRSSYVSRDVTDTVEWIKPELIKKFASGDDTMRFEPEGPSDVQAAQQATDYVSYLFFRKNPGFRILYEWINDGLLQKDGIVKCWWDTDKSVVREEYEGLTEMELQMLLADDRVELLEKEYRDVELPDGNVVQVCDVAVGVEGAQSGITVENIPPEEFIMSSRGKCIATTPFCAHRRLMPVSDIRAMGFEVDLEKDGLDFDSSINWEEEKRARHKIDDTNPEDQSSTYADDTTREVWVDEAYIRMDRNQDGISELLKVFKSGDKVFSIEEVDHPPFAAWSPIIISHKFNGMSIADLVMDLQRLQSQLFRNIIDNQYLTNNGRYAAVENMVNLGDLQNSKPGGVVRIRQPGAVTQLPTPQLGAHSFQMLEYVERLREKRTGVSERTQGIDPNSLGPNTAAHAVNQVMTAAQQRIELIARVFGETGLKDLFLLIYKEVLQNSTSKDVFRLNDRYVEVDPREWKERKDMTVVVGLGNGSRDNELQQMQMVLQTQLQLLSNPDTMALVSPENLYAAVEDMVKITNKAASGRYYTDPSDPQVEQKQKKSQQEAQQNEQLQKQMAQQALANESKSADAKMLSAQADAQRKKEQTQIEQAELVQKDEHHSDDIALDHLELELEAALEAEQERGVELG